METKRNIIIVDDDKLLQQCAYDIMIEFGHKILCRCKNSYETIEAFRIFQYTNPIIIFSITHLHDTLNTFKTIQKIMTFNNIIIVAPPNIFDDVKPMVNAGCLFFEKPNDYNKISSLLEEIDTRPVRTFTKDEIGSEWLSLKNELEFLKQKKSYSCNLIKKRIQQIQRKYELY